MKCKLCKDTGVRSGVEQFGYGKASAVNPLSVKTRQFCDCEAGKALSYANTPLDFSSELVISDEAHCKVVEFDSGSDRKGLAYQSRVPEDLSLLPHNRYIGLLKSFQSKRVHRSYIRRMSVILFDTDDLSKFDYPLLDDQLLVGLQETLLAQDLSTSLINSYTSVYKSLASHAADYGFIDGFTLNRIMKVKNVGKPERKRQPFELSNDDKQNLLRALADTLHPASASRNQALCAVQLYCALRVDEALSLTLKNVDLTGNRLVFRGKGAKERSVPMPPITKRLLLDWFDQFLMIGPGDVDTPDDEPIFRRILRNGELAPLKKNREGKLVGLGRNGWAKVLREACLKANLPILTPHNLRGNAITSVLRGGAGIEIASKVAGHSSIETTKIYDYRGDDEVRDAIFNAAM